MALDEEPQISINVETIEGRQFIRCSDFNSPRPVYDNVRTPTKLMSRIRLLNQRINHLKEIFPNRQDVLASDLQELTMLEHEVREEERTQLLRAVP